MGAGALQKCKSLKRAVLNEGLQMLGDSRGVAFVESGIEEVTLPSTLKRLEIGTFNNCKNLKGICLPEQLEFIGEECFFACGIEGITIPNSVATIGPKAFTGCQALKKVVFHGGSRLRKVEASCF